MEETNYHISQHCRERYVQRFTKKERYAHLDSCYEEHCPQCNVLRAEIHDHIRNNWHQINGDIRGRLRLADEEKSFINNTSFMNRYYEKYGYSRFSFLVQKDVVFVCKEDNFGPVIVTCLYTKHSIVRGVKSRKKYKKKQPVEI